jgi:fructoselysine 6-phosphate deglycase
MLRPCDRDVEVALSALSGNVITHVFLVACGGSLSIMQAGKYFLDRYSSIASDALNADEFTYRDPRRLSEQALVIVCSQTGTTQETVRAAQHAKFKGAHCIGMTLDPDSPLAKEVDWVVRYQASYTTGIPINAADSNYAVLYRLLAGFLGLAEGIELLPRLLTSLAHLQAAIERAHIKLEPRFAKFVGPFGGASAIYTLASGPNYAAAYSFSTCVLMEMQWYASQAIHANEFFHGPFEIVDKTANFIVMIGCDETRALTERARDFLHRFGSAERVLVLDANELDLEGIDETFRAYLLPLIFFDTLWKFAFRLAEIRKHPMLTGRRYMKKLVGY